MTRTITPLDLQQDEIVVVTPERRQRLAAGIQPVRQLPAGASEKARRAEQRKCLTNARLAAHSGLTDIAQAWVTRAASYCPVSERSLAAIKRSYDRGRDYRADQAEQAATLTARARFRLPAAARRK